MKTENKADRNTEVKEYIHPDFKNEEAYDEDDELAAAGVDVKEKEDTLSILNQKVKKI